MLDSRDRGGLGVLVREHRSAARWAVLWFWLWAWAASAQTAAVPVAGSASLVDLSDPSRGWTVRADAMAHYLAPGGRFTLPGEVRGGRDIDVELVNLDSPRVSPYGDVTIFAGRWRFGASAVAFESDREFVSSVSRAIGDIDLAAGDAARASLEFATADLLAGYRLVERRVDASSDGTAAVVAYLDGTGGLRLYQTAIEVERAAGGQAEADETFVEPFVGLRAGAVLHGRLSAEMFGALGYGEWGGSSSAQSFDVGVRFAYRATDHVSAVLGYRLLAFTLEDGEQPEMFEFRGSMAGVYAGLRVEF